MNYFLKILFNTFLGAILIIAVLMIVPVLPIPGNYQVRVVLSGSMEPAIKTGSIIFVRPAKSYQVNDVITFTSGDFRGPKGEIIPVTHRIMEVKPGEFGTGYITKGDANDSNDRSMTRDQNVLGKVFLNIPYLGYAVETARQPYGFLTLILIPAIIIIGDQVKNIFNEVKKMKKPGIEEELRTENQ